MKIIVYFSNFVIEEFIMKGRVSMKKPERRRTLRTMILSAILVAALSCCTAVFFSVNAAENTEQQPVVTTSDEAGNDSVDQADDEQVVKNIIVSAKQVGDCSHYRFKPNARYNGSFRSELLDNEVVIYDALVNAFITNKSNAPVKIDVSSMGYVYDRVDELADGVLSAYAAFTTDHPEAYWMSGYGLSLSTLDNTIISVTVTIDERYSGDYGDLNTVLSGISSAVSTISANRASTSRYDTVKAIHDYICNTMSYDNEAASTDNYNEAHCIAPLFGGGSRGHQFVCEGYANSFKLLCDKFGIPAVHVKGNAGGPHSWNYVQMENGCWYGVDATWDDQSTIYYTYFLVGTNSVVFNGKTFGQDHVPQNQVMSSDTVNPLVYPVLSDETYVPGDHFDFWGNSAEDNRVVSGLVDFSWKFIGQKSVTNVVDVYLDNSLLTTLDEMGDGNIFTYQLNASGLENGTHTVKAVFRKSGSDPITVSRSINVQNIDFDFCDWTQYPVVSGNFEVRMKQSYGGTSLECKVEFYVDDVYRVTLYCDNDGFFNYVIDTTKLSNGDHIIKAVFSNNLNQTIIVENLMDVENPAFEIYNWTEDIPTFSDGVDISMRQYNCGTPANNSVDVLIDDALFQSLQSDSNGYFSYYLDTTQLLNGVHTLKAILRTQSGLELTDEKYFAVYNEIPATSLSLDQHSVSVNLGETVKLNAEVLPFNTSDGVVWTSSDESVATVKSNGLVTSTGVGQAIITATAGDKSDFCTVTVTNPISYPVTLSKSAISVIITSNNYHPSVSLTAKKPNTIKKVVWYSDDTDVATVNQSGKITAEGEGTANIYCMSESGEFLSAPCKVSVGVFVITYSERTYANTIAIPIGQMTSLGIYASYIPGYDDAASNVTWKSSNVKLASLQPQLSSCDVYGIKKGTVTVTASLGRTCSTSYKVNVFVPTDFIDLSSRTASVYVGKTVTLKPIQSKGANDPLYWESDDESIATVTDKGVVKGIAQGTAKIRVYTYGGIDWEEAVVTVCTPAKAVTWDTVPPAMNPRSAVKCGIAQGETLDLYAKITEPENCNDTITWTTSNGKVVAINNLLDNGRGVCVVGNNKGTATITAKTGSGKKIVYQVTVVPQSAQEIVLNKHEANLYTGASVALSAQVLPKGCNDVVLWNSSDPGIATVDENGRVTAVAQGDVTITAYSATSGDAVDVASIHVLTKATSFTWDTVPDNMKPLKTVKYGIAVGDEMELCVKIIAPENCNDTITWTTSNKSVVAITDYVNGMNGVHITGLKKGTATITAKTGSGKSITYTINVVPESAQQIIINKHEANVYAGASLGLSAQVLPKGNNDVVLWKSSDPDIATVDENGKVTAVAQGDVTVTAYSATSGSVMDTALIHVLTKATGFTWGVIPGGMKPSKTVKLGINVNEVRQLSAIITSPENCNDTITWTTSNKAVVAVEATDDKAAVMITGLKKGTAIVTAKTGSGKTITYTITVVEGIPDSVTLSKQEVNLYVGSSVSISAKLLPKTCNDVVHFVSLDPEIASVDENGKITGLCNGEACILAYASTCQDVTSAVRVKVMTKATAIDMSATSVTIPQGSSTIVYASLTPYDCGDTVTWTASGKGIVNITTLYDGTSAMIIGNKVGTSTVRAKTGSGKYKDIKVVVTKAPVSDSTNIYLTLWGDEYDHQFF